MTCPTSEVTVTLQPHEVFYNMSVQDDDGDVVDDDDDDDVDPSKAS